MPVNQVSLSAPAQSDKSLARSGAWRADWPLAWGVQMSKTINLISAAILLGMASSAQAGVSDDFAACDGRMKPKGSDDGMRGEAAIKPSWQTYGSGKGPAAVIAACDKMILHPNLKPNQTVRRAHMLRARAAARLELGQAKEALADLDAAEAATADKAQDSFYQRSMGVSLRMLRALALAQIGERDAAWQLAIVTAAERPYATQIQLAAAMLRPDTGGGAAAPEATLASDRALRLDPGSGLMLARKAAQVGAFDEVVRLAAEIQNQEAPQPLPNGRYPISTLVATSERSVAAVALNYDLAFALAATGKPDRAREALALARTKAETFSILPTIPLSTKPTAAATSASSASPVAATAPTVPSAPASAEASQSTVPALAPVPPPPPSLLKQLFAASDRLAEARILLAEGKVVDASRVAAGSLPTTAATAEFLAAMAKAEDKVPPLLPAGMDRAGNRFGMLAEMLLIAPESQRSVIDYQKSRPNILGAVVGGVLSLGTTLLGGIERTAGFRSSANPDGSTKVEYTGNTTSAPVVQEMTLLRAAELARAANKWGFVIERRSDYSRFMVASQYGMEISRTPIGYMTELNVRFVDQDTDPQRAFDAVATIDALGPLYYSEAKPKP